MLSACRATHKLQEKFWQEETLALQVLHDLHAQTEVTSVYKPLSSLGVTKILSVRNTQAGTCKEQEEEEGAQVSFFDEGRNPWEDLEMTVVL